MVAEVENGGSDALLDRFSEFFSSLSGAGSTDHHTQINPATGLPMVGGIGSVDVMGNTYGTELHRWEDSSIHDTGHNWHNDHGTCGWDHWSHNTGCGHDSFSGDW